MKVLTQAKRRQGSGVESRFWAEYMYVARAFDYGDCVVLGDAPQVGVLRLVGLQPPLHDGPGKAYLQTNRQIYSRSRDLFQIIACVNPSAADIEDLDEDDVDDDAMGYGYCEPLDSADKKYFKTISRRRFFRRVGRGGVVALVGLTAVTGIGAAVLSAAAFIGATTVGTASAIGGGAVLIASKSSASKSRNQNRRTVSRGSRGHVRSSASRSRPRKHISSGGRSRPRVGSGGGSRPRISGGGSRRSTARVSSRPKARVGSGRRQLGAGR